MKKSYLFYDIETTGLNKCFDQVVQFAAIRTDLELNKLAEYNIIVKLNPDIIPSPKALITHNISFDTMENGICEYEAMRKIHQLMNQPGTISLGYNTLKFDDEFLRFSFYRNLLPPYTHQYANSCSRMDLYPMTVMYFLYKNEVIKWPEDNLKLENISTLNNLATGDAHDALVDVEATIALARQFINYRDMWNYLCSYFDKTSDLERISKLNEALLIDGSFGVANHYQAEVISLGRHNHYKNQSLWLRLDSKIPEEAYVVRKKVAETGLLLPLESRFTRYLGARQLQLAAKNRKFLTNHPEVFQDIASYHCDYKYPVIANIDIDAALYQNGFPSATEEFLAVKFHAADIREKIELVKEMPLFMQQQALRILWRNYPECLSNSDYQYHRGVDYKGQPALTATAALAEIKELRSSVTLNSKQQDLLERLAASLSLS